MHQLYLCKGVNPTLNECPGYSIKQSDGKAAIMVVLWEMRSSPSLPSLLGTLWPGVVATDRVLSMGQIDTRTVCKEMTYAKQNFGELNSLIIQMCKQKTNV